jgi:hypothetical protein
LRSREALPALLPGGPISNSALGCLASVLIAALVNVEHRRALQSSALTGVYLFLSLISDALLSGVFLSFAQTHTAGRLAIVAAVMKLALLILLEMPKRRRIADPAIRHDIADEETSGFWSRSFLVWLNKTLLLGFQKIITVDDLGSLGLELSSKALSDRLELALRQRESLTIQTPPNKAALHRYDDGTADKCVGRSLVAFLSHESLFCYIQLALLSKRLTKALFCRFDIRSAHVSSSCHCLHWG